MKITLHITGGDKTGKTRRSLNVRIPRVIVDDAGIKNGDIVEMDYQPRSKKIIITFKED